jgi:hypothetical protein
MNIIKFKDIIVTDTSLPDVEWYNDNLRGKYAYWIRCHVVVPLESITPNMYVSFETTINNLFAYNYYVLTDKGYGMYSYELLSLADTTANQRRAAVLVESVPTSPTAESPVLIKTDGSTIKYVDLWEGDWNWMNGYVDQTETDTVNSVDALKQYNNYIPTKSPGIEELKRFRTWLATSLLDQNYTFYIYNTDHYDQLPNPTLDQRLSAKTVTELPSEDEGVVKIENLEVVNWTDDNTHVLEYYRGGMYDDTLKWVGEFGKTVVNLTQPSQSSCGCGSNTNLSSLYGDGVSVCDSVEIYKSGIKNGMIEFFSDVETWTELPKSYILNVKSYVDGIIQSNLGFSTYEISNGYYGCECVSSNNSQTVAVAILEQLSKAFDIIAQGESEVNKHKNFIIVALQQWSSQLYELMEWN